MGKLIVTEFVTLDGVMEGTGDFGRKMNEMPKYVVSATLENPEWQNTTVVRGDLAGEVDALKHRFAGDVLVAGSARLVQGLLAADLVDELHLMVFPVVLGAGKRLFADTADSKAFAVVETRHAGETVVLTLRPRR